MASFGVIIMAHCRSTIHFNFAELCRVYSCIKNHTITICSPVFLLDRHDNEWKKNKIVPAPPPPPQPPRTPPPHPPPPKKKKKKKNPHPHPTHPHPTPHHAILHPVNIHHVKYRIIKIYFWYIFITTLDQSPFGTGLRQWRYFFYPTHTNALSFG